MPLYSFEGLEPTVHPAAFVAPTASLIGDVLVEEGASIWYGVVIRADYCRIVIRAGANVQDGSVLHGGPDTPMELGRNATIAHSCVVHGAVIGEESIVGNASTIMDGVTIGRRSLVAAHSMVAMNTEVPDKVLVAGSPAKVRRDIEDGTPLAEMLDVQYSAYQELAQRHLKGITEVTR